jgi:hypothetical protein
MGKTKDLSEDCKNTVLNLFKFFQLEKARGRPFYSPVVNDRLYITFDIYTHAYLRFTSKILKKN